MRGRKPRTPEQKAYIAAKRALNKAAEKYDKAEGNYHNAIDHLREVQLTVPPDELAAVHQLFPEKEKNVIFNNITSTGNMNVSAFVPENIHFT